MLDKVDFANCFGRVCEGFARKANDTQVDVYYEALKYNKQEHLQDVYTELIRNCKRFPFVPDWIDAFNKFKHRDANNSRPATGTCPKCGGGTDDKILEDKEWYEVCRECGWKEILYTIDEWKAKFGHDGMSIVDISNKLRYERVRK